MSGRGLLLLPLGGLLAEHGPTLPARDGTGRGPCNAPCALPHDASDGAVSDLAGGTTGVTRADRHADD